MEGVDEEVSNEVDKNIVEMEFKNAEFEKNAAKTLQTLQELKAKINNNFSTKGPEELNRAIKAVDVSPITKGLDAVQVKFSALQIAGKRIIENIVDSAMRGIANVKNKLMGVVNQIKVGGANRAQNIEQAKFMLEGFGIQWAQIEEDISFGVQDTAYGLDAAAKVASQLVASNVSLGDDMKHALLGISGVAAMTNSTYEDIGRIFTQVAGQGRVMGDQLLQLSGRGLNVAAELAKTLNVTESEVRQMTSKGQIDFKTFSEAMYNAFGPHAKEANKTFTGALLNTKAALSRLGADIQTQKFESFRIILLEVTTQLKETKKAFKPAEDAIISMMDAVGKLVSSFIKSINIKGIVDRITPSIKKVADYIKDFANAWRELREEATPVNNIAEYVQKLKGGMTETKEATDEALTSIDKLARASETDLKKYADNAWAIWNEGKFGNGPDRISALGEDYELTQAYVEKMIELGWDEAKMQEYLAEQRKKTQQQQAKEQVVNKLRTTVSKILTIFTNIRRVITNITTSIGNIIKAMFGGLTEAFVGKGKGFLDGVVTITGAIANFSDKLVITKERAEKIRPITKIIGDIIVSIGKGLITVVKYLLQFIKAASESKIVRGIFEAIGKVISSIFTALGNLYRRLKETGVWDKFVNVLKVVATWLGERIIDALNLLGDVAIIIGGGLENVFSKVIEKIKDMKILLENVKDVFEVLTTMSKDIFKTAFENVTTFINGFIQAIKNLSKEDLNLILKSLVNVALTLSTIKWIWSMIAVNKSFTSSISSFQKMFDTLGVTINKYGKRADAQRFESFSKSVATIVGSFIALMLTFAFLESKDFDVHTVAVVSGTIVGVVAIIVGLVTIISEKIHQGDTITGNTTNVLDKVKLPRFALTLLAIAFMIQTLIKTIMTIYNMVKSGTFDTKTFGLISAAIVGIMTAIGIFVAVISKQEPKMAGLTGLAFTIISIGILISTMTSSFKKVLKMIQGYTPKDVDKAVDVLQSFLTPLLIFAGAIVLIPKLLAKLPGGGSNVVNTQDNPFKGMTGMMLGLVVMLRVGFLPLLREIAAIRNESKSGVEAINSFKSIVNGVMIFVGILTALVLLLDRTVRRDGKVFGSEFVDGKYVGDVTTGGKFSAFQGKGIWGIVGIVASVSAIFFAISSVMKNMKGVDSHAISRFKELSQSILVIVGIISGIGAVIGVVDKTGTTMLVLLSIAAVIASVAAMLLSAGYGFKAFKEALIDFVNSLPNAVTKLFEFFNLIKDNKDEIVSGVRETARVFLDGVTAAVVGWSEGLAENVPIMIHNIMLALIVTLNGVADELNNQGPELVNAADRAATAMIKFLGLVFEKMQEKGRKFFKAVGIKLGGLLVESMNPWTKKALGLDDLNEFEGDEALTQAYWDKQAELERKAYEKAMRENIPQDSNWYADYYGGSSAETDNFEIVAQEQLEKAYNSFNKGAKKKIQSLNFTDIQNLLGENFDIENLMSDFKVGDFSQFGNLGIDTNGLAAAFENFNWEAEGAADNAEGILNDFFNNSNTEWNNYVDGYSEYGEDMMDNVGEGINERMVFVTDITHDAMEAAVNEIGQFREEFYNGGIYCGQGFAFGLADAKSSDLIIKSAADMVLAAKHGVEVTGKIQSPSKVFMQLGKFITMGFANGIYDSISLATSSANEVGEATILSMRETIKQASLEAVNGIDSPRITPVLDLSNVTEGIGIMNSMFDTSHAVGLGITTSTEARAATSRRIAAVYQNGSNYDDTNAIGAINSLQGEVSTLKDTINGMQVVIDGRALVGQIATPMDKALGKKALAGRRGI